jgi:hypothetical protein
LGPILFLCFIDDIFNVVENELNVFADDSTLSRIITSVSDRAAAAASLNRDLLALQAWAALWLVTFNDTKTELVTVSRKADVAEYRLGKPQDPLKRRRGRPRKHERKQPEEQAPAEGVEAKLEQPPPHAPTNPHPPLVFCGLQLKESKSFKIVGLTITYNLSWTEHVGRIAKHANRAVAMMKRASNILDKSALAAVYKSSVRSRMEYCCPIWMAAGKSALARLDKVDARARRLLGKDESLQLPSLSHRRWVAGLCVFHRLFHRNCPPALHDLCPAMSAEQPVRASLRARGARRTVTSAPARPSVRAPEYWTNSFVPRFALAFSNLPPQVQSEASAQKFKVLTNKITHSFD